MTSRIGHAPLGAAGSWLPILADPRNRDPSPALPPVTSEGLATLVEAGAAHGVVPVMRRQMRRLGGRIAAAQALDEAVGSLDRQRVALAGQALFLSHHARRIGAALADAKLAATVVKGITFATKLYSSPADRSFTDIDVLLAPPAVAKTTEILRDLGYVAASEWDAHDNDRAEMKWLLPGHDILLIELQTNLIHSHNLRSGIRVDYDALLAVGGGDPGDATAQLFVAAVHGAAGHQFDRLQPAVDTVQAARGTAGPIDRTRLIRVARATGATVALQAALDLAAGLFQEPAARDLADALGASFPRRLGKALLPPRVALRAQEAMGWRDSWRRRALRELIRRAGRNEGRPSRQS